MADLQIRQAYERSLLDRIRHSDPTALDELLQSGWDALVGFAYRYTHVIETAEDIAQESFVRLWTGRKQWRADSSPGAILYRIARNLALDERRSRHVRGRTNELDLNLPAPVTPVQLMEETELRARLEAALAALSERDREIFMLSRQEGLTYAEIAEVVSLAPQTVANLLHSVLKHLRHDLSEFLTAEPNANVLTFRRRA
jgi:RNA polymerase sigma-70 factor, ECF subfamily